MDEFRLLLDLNAYHKKLIADKVIEGLRQLTNLLLSGVDSGLKNCWEEICVQVQGEESVDWDAYENTIANFISAELEVQPEAVVNVLKYIAKIEVIEGHEQFTDEEYIIREIMNTVRLKAEFFTNRNISRYLDNY